MNDSYLLRVIILKPLTQDMAYRRYMGHEYQMFTLVLRIWDANVSELMRSEIFSSS